jgi:hypothetical protein
VLIEAVIDHPTEDGRIGETVRHEFARSLAMPSGF